MRCVYAKLGPNDIFWVNLHVRGFRSKSMWSFNDPSTECLDKESLWLNVIDCRKVISDVASLSIVNGLIWYEWFAREEERNSRKERVWITVKYTPLTILNSEQSFVTSGWYVAIRWMMKIWHGYWRRCRLVERSFLALRFAGTWRKVLFKE